MIEWRIYYGEGTTFSNADGEPWDAPATGVQCVVKTDSQVGRIVLSTCDYYWFDYVRRTWLSGDIAGFYQYLMIDKGPKAVLFGKYISNEEYHACMVAALADPDFPVKSARHSSEAAR